MTSPLATLHNTLQTLSTRLTTNLSSSVASLSAQDVIRIIIIGGGYCLLRPYLIKLGGRFQARDHEREVDASELSSGAAVSPNSLRGRVGVPGEDEDDGDEEEEAEGSGVDWGRAARKRQRAVLRKLLDAEERARQEEAEGIEDRDIEEFLEK
ncbi:MAG: hypothetical protein M1832_003635 [Thelocarpon impressellum]|nr:MAG: hypothetical protein M1832_003635 [Thelocarpon impressellum]